MNPTAAMTHYTRPEDRCRGNRPAWSDSIPACFRSEAFAEDLDSPSEAAPARTASRAPMPAWRLWLAPQPG